MKTSLACLGILIAALVFGQYQHARIARLEHLSSSSKAVRPSKGFPRDRINSEQAYRTKYERTSTDARADDVFQSLLKFRAARTSVSGGPMAPTAMENKQALQAIMQLDLPNLEVLLQLISKSDDPVFKKEELVRCEQTVLCLTAIADIDPERALELICHSHEQIGPFFADRMWADPLVKYVLTRLSDRDPQGALDALIRITKETPEIMSVDSHNLKQLLGVVARNDPGLVLDTIQKFPEATQPGMVHSLEQQLESDDERVALFHASRVSGHSQSETMDLILKSFCGRFSYSALPSSDTIALINRLEMTDEEKPIILKALRRTNIPESGQEEFAKWAADFFPDSTEKMFLLWGAASGWDSAKFLSDHGIDPEELIKREMEFR